MHGNSEPDVAVDPRLGYAGQTGAEARAEAGEVNP